MSEETVNKALQPPQFPSLNPSEAETARTGAGHREINMTWERTQQVISIWLVFVTTSVCAYIVVYGDMSMRMAAFLLLSNFCTSVVTTYFIRTNHTKSAGGIEQTR